MESVTPSSRLTFWEAASIIIGHGIGAGILSVPYLASRNSWWDMLWIAAAAYLINLLLHFMIAELSYNNGGAQFIRCFERELFVGKIGKLLTWVAFALLGFSTMVNVSGFITGAAAALTVWLGLPELAAMLLFYIVSAGIVYLGLKVVGVCEKIAVFSMVGVVGILLAATLLSELSPLSTSFIASSNLLALYSMVAFSLSAVMSTPQVVKGLQGDVKRIRGAIAAGTGMACGLVLLRGGSTEDMSRTIDNMASSITGMICDGGNQGCAMKGVVAVDAAYRSAAMAMKNVYIYPVHGINGPTPEETMLNMGQIASPGMVGTEKTIVEILEHKSAGR